VIGVVEEAKTIDPADGRRSAWCAPRREDKHYAECAAGCPVKLGPSSAQTPQLPCVLVDAVEHVILGTVDFDEAPWQRFKLFVVHKVFVSLISASLTRGRLLFKGRRFDFSFYF
jgi:hypothetical protein